MNSPRVTVLALVAALAGGTTPSLSAAPSTRKFCSSAARLCGTAKDEAKKPFTDYTVQAREAEQGHVAGAVPLDDVGNFELAGLKDGKYLIELLNRQGKVVCMEGPIDLQKLRTVNLREDVFVAISCGHVPAAWWLLGAASAAGITAGVVAGETASPAR